MEGSGGHHPAWLRVDVILALVVVCAAAAGLFGPGAYLEVTELQRQTWRAQDAVNLLVAPTLMLASRRAASGAPRAHLLRLGLLAWLAYCFAHLAFGARFGPVFLLYVAGTGLAGFGFLDGFVRTDLAGQAMAPRFPARLAAAFFGLADSVSPFCGSARSCRAWWAWLSRPTCTWAGCPTRPGCSTWPG